MEEHGYKQSANVALVTDAIVKMLDPTKIYLYNQRLDNKGHTASFKLCVILQTDDKHAAEQDIYLNIDCDVPFDVLLYTPEEWEEHTHVPSAFASKIKQMGAVLYG